MLRAPSPQPVLEAAAFVRVHCGPPPPVTAKMEGDETPRGGWLYVRGRYSVYIVPTHDPPTLLVLGPSTSRVEHRPADMRKLIELQSDIEADLRSRGWTFEGAEVDRRHGDDRRRWPRWSERRYDHRK
jgi:hypothetical protein